MKNKTYLKASFREIKQSLGRFIAIALIVMLGTVLFVGVKTAGPVMQRSMNQYVSSQHLSDLQIISTGGLTKKDVDQAKGEGRQVETGKQFSYASAEKNEVVQVYSFDPNNRQNQLHVTQGRLPKAPNELVLDRRAKQEGYQINQTYRVAQEEDLERTNYTIVGFVDSPLYINDLERGATNVGNGTIDYFAYVPVENFKTEIYSVLYVSFDNVNPLSTYRQAYQNQMAENSRSMENQFSDRPEKRKEELQQTIQERLAPARQEVRSGTQQLQQGQNQLDQGQAQIDQQRAGIAQLPEDQRTQAEAQLTQAQETLDQQRTQLTEARERLADAQRKLEEGEEQAASVETPTYLYNERSENVGFQEYGDLADRIAAIANVFPVFFFFIAALITFTTMTRMVEENRREIGTLKALGYTKFEISKKYIIYALSAASLGLVFGVILGTNTLPRIIFYLSSERYNLQQIDIFYDWIPILQSIGAFLIASLGSAMFVLMRDLRERPAALLQPKAPKPGKRIFLEYIPALWSRFSFNQKISYRNLFRYKSRMIMAIIGIAGCAGLMVAGVGLRDSLDAVADKQFGPITRYQAIVTLAQAPESNQTEKLLTQKEEVSHYLAIRSQQVELRAKGRPSQDLTMMVPESQTDFDQYVHLQSPSDSRTVTLGETGGVLTEKAAEEFDVSVGETVTIYDDDQRRIDVRVTGITENYLGNFIYLSKPAYEAASKQTFEKNTYLLKLSNLSAKEEEQLSRQLIDTGEVSNTTFMSDQIETQEESMSNLDSIVWIFVVLSGTLAFIVLYNLTNINISERVRELSTIKVLGFFDREVTMYIVRENVIFTLIGILFGYGVGYLLTAFILQQAAMESVIFPLVIRWPAFVLSGGLTIFFTIIVMLITHFKLKHIHMIDALKSNE